MDETLEKHSRRAWREWLSLNHDSKKEIWLIYYKKASAKPSISYEASVEEALCYGWIDGQMKSLDEERFARRFTPRRKGSSWSENNKTRALTMLREGKMREAGLVTLPEEILAKWTEQTGPRG